MLVVLGIIAVLAGIVITLTLRVDNQSKERALDSAFSLLNSALREYYEVQGQVPGSQPHAAIPPYRPWRTSSDGPGTPIRAGLATGARTGSIPAWSRTQAGTADLAELRDPWGTLLDYVYDDLAGDTFPELISAGPDKKFGTADDISSKGTTTRA